MGSKSIVWVVHVLVRPWTKRQEVVVVMNG